MSYLRCYKYIEKKGKSSINTTFALFINKEFTPYLCQNKRAEMYSLIPFMDSESFPCFLLLRISSVKSKSKKDVVRIPFIVFIYSLQLFLASMVPITDYKNYDANFSGFRN